MKVSFTWKAIGWFMAGWSAEFPRGEVRPLRYFGEDLVTYRDEAGELHILTGQCRHPGAHIGYGGKVLDGSSSHRLIFATTPVDDECFDLFYSIWWPRKPGAESDVPPPEVQERVGRQFLVTVWEDLSIWRHQKYVEHPPLSPKDAEPFLSLRKWAQQFYDAPPAETGIPA